TGVTPPCRSQTSAAPVPTAASASAATAKPNRLPLPPPVMVHSFLSRSARLVPRPVAAAPAGVLADSGCLLTIRGNERSPTLVRECPPQGPELGSRRSSAER